jgi:hypothetical protein
VLRSSLHGSGGALLTGIGTPLLRILTGESLLGGESLLAGLSTWILKMISGAAAAAQGRKIIVSFFLVFLKGKPTGLG